MPLSPSESLAAIAAYVPPSPVETTVSDLARILALPRRAPVVCERDPVTKRFPPATQALIEVETARYSRGARVSCACRPRRVEFAADGRMLTIWRLLPSGYPPEPPVLTTREAFAADNQTPGDLTALRTVAAMAPGGRVDLPATAGGVGDPCITTLNAIQSWMMRELREVGGIVGFMGTGCGKTVGNLLAPLAFPDARLAVLCIESTQWDHYRRHYLWLREHFRVTSIVCGDAAIPGSTVPGTTPLHLLAYSRLSLIKNSDMLDRLDPEVLGLDECHRACGDSAIRRRVERFCAGKIAKREAAMREGKPVRARAVNLYDASGTLESKSCEDSQMLCAFTLGKGSPLPLDPNESKAWTQVLDPVYRPDRKSSTAKSLQRAFGGGEYDESDFGDLLVGDEPEIEIRKGYSKWRRETPGVISASASSINAAIYFSERKPKGGIPKAVQDALTMIRVEWKRPDGDELVEKIEQVACARHVGVGLYPYWAFPAHPCTCPCAACGKLEGEHAREQAKGGNHEFKADALRRCGECLLIADWFAKRKRFNKVLRVKQQRGEVQLDSPKLCEQAAERACQDPPYKGELPVWDCEEWPDWRDIRDRVQYVERVKWIDDWLARDAAEWALDNKERGGKAGIVWFKSVAFGRRVADLTGLPYFNGGPGCEQRLGAEKGDRSIICSIKALGASTDGLQRKFCHQLIVELPASNSSKEGMEQLLARLHREGQKSDAVYTQAYLHTVELYDALKSAYRQAQFNYTMQQNMQKLLFTDFDKGIEL